MRNTDAETIWDLRKQLSDAIAKNTELAAKLERARAYASYCKTEALSCQRPIEFSQWVTNYATPGVPVSFVPGDPAGGGE